MKVFNDSAPMNAMRLLITWEGRGCLPGLLERLAAAMRKAINPCNDSLNCDQCA
jgi:hypothetical protein